MIQFTNKRHYTYVCSTLRAEDNLLLTFTILPTHKLKALLVLRHHQRANTMKTTFNHHCTKLAAAFGMLCILLFAACDKEPGPPAYGLQSETRVKNLKRVLDKMETFSRELDPESHLSFVGTIGDRPVTVQGRIGEAAPYWAGFDRITALRAC